MFGTDITPSHCYSRIALGCKLYPALHHPAAPAAQLPLPKPHRCHSLQRAVGCTHSMGPGQPASWGNPICATQEGPLAGVSTAKATC
jgi:hypothetical protein